MNTETISEEWINKMVGEKIDSWGLPKSDVSEEVIRDMWIKRAKSDIQSAYGRMRRMGISSEQILLMEYKTVEVIISYADAENTRYQIEDAVREWLDSCPV